MFSGKKTKINERHNVITFQSLYHKRIETNLILMRDKKLLHW